MRLRNVRVSAPRLFMVMTLAASVSACGGGNETPNTAARVVAVPRSARNQMNVAMLDRLSGRGAHVDSHVVPVRLEAAIQ